MYLVILVNNKLLDTPIIAGVPDGRTADESDVEKNLHGEKLGGLDIDPTRVPPYSTVYTGIHRYRTGPPGTYILLYCSATATEYVVLQKVRVHSIICDSFDLTKSWI